MRSLKSRGLAGVQLVIDAHAGLRAAIDAVLIGASWQRRRVHFLRNVLAEVPERFSPDGGCGDPHRLRPARSRARPRNNSTPGMLGRQFPKVETMLREAAEDITAFADFPVPHWKKKIWSNNPLERLKKEIKRRTEVVGMFPNPAAHLRLAGSVLVEAHDEWQIVDKRYLSEISLAQPDVPDPNAEIIAPTTALTA